MRSDTGLSGVAGSGRSYNPKMRPEPRLTLETPERAVVSLEVAGLGPRALAYLVDLLLVFLGWMTALLAYSIVGDLLRRVQQLSAVAQIGAVVAFFALGWCYDIAWEMLWHGQTPGKRLLGLRVARADGSPVGFVDSVVRNVLRAAEIPLLYAPGVLAIALTPRHQRLGDLVAGTLVLRDRAYDLSRYSAPALDPRYAALRGRAAAALSHADYERLSEFLQRRGTLLDEARSRIGGKIAAALAGRAGVAPPAPGEVERFLEAFAAYAAEGAH